ncbi:MAG: hypothetical protein AAGA21_10860 [Pseudomonadota bacterium]
MTIQALPATAQSILELRDAFGDAAARGIIFDVEIDSLIVGDGVTGYSRALTTIG